MEEFDLNKFTTAIKQILYENMPTETQPYKDNKWKGRTGKIKDVALGNNQIIPMGTDKYYFEIGNELAEQNQPYYHILEDAEVIAKKGMSTKKSRGSQQYIADRSKRDYGIVQFRKTKSGKIGVYQEYRKNVRGERSKIDKSQRITRIGDNKYYINENSKYYVNTYYHYIEKALDLNINYLAKDFGLVPKRIDIDYTTEYNDYIESLNEYENSLSWETD